MFSGYHRRKGGAALLGATRPGQKGPFGPYGGPDAAPSGDVDEAPQDDADGRDAEAPTAT